jgi:hypothetical protein
MIAEGTTERRSHERIPCSAVLLRYAKRSALPSLVKRPREGGKPVPVRDISWRGLRFLSREKLSPGEELQMTIKLARHHRPVHAVGEVIWCGEGQGLYPCAVGARFTGAGPRSWDRLKRVGEIVERRTGKKWDAWRLRSRERRSRIWGGHDEQ